MKSITATWFIAKVQYVRTNEEGLEKKVTESYVVDALNYTEAEERIINEMSSFITGDYKIKSITPASFSEYFYDDDKNAERYYKCKYNIITLDEERGVETRKACNILVLADSFGAAVQIVRDCLHDSICDWEISAVAEIPICDVFMYKTKTADK